MIRTTAFMLLPLLLPAHAGASSIADDCARVEARVADLAGRWLSSLPMQARAGAVAELLRDDVAVVRLAAVEEIERLLRDGMQPDQELATAAAQLLGDSDARVRRRVGRLVIDLGVPSAGERLAAGLAREAEDSVVEAWLEALLAAPTPSAFTPAAARLDDAVHGEGSAKLLAELVRLGRAPLSWKATLAPSLRTIANGRATPSVALLVAQLGEAADVALAARLLANAAPAVRRGAAEGFLRAGESARVFARANDPAIAVVVMAAIARERPTRAGFDELLVFQVSGEARDQRHDRLAEVATKLSASDLLEADAGLLAARTVDARTRLRIFDAGARRFTGTEDAHAAAVVVRLAEQLVAMGRRGDAVSRLEASKPTAGTSLAEALFRARLSAGRFEDAARQDPSPARWVLVAGRLASSGDSSARALIDEMKLRFGPRLSVEERRQLGSVEGVLLAAPARAD